QIIEEILKLSVEKQKKKLLKIDPHALDKKEFIKEKKELPELPNIKKYKKILMRLAPYPSGALHIGNARMIVLNDAYIKRYNGELILFYDDTIGSPKALRNSPNAKYVLPEAYDLIKEGLEWLGVKYSKVYYKSDRLEIYYKYCEKLIKDGIAYICFCQANEFKTKYKNQRKNCPHRAHSIEKNLEEWSKMLNGEYKETEAVVRIKTGMTQKDPALRDQIIMRISEASHPRVGTKYKVWPMLEFSWAIDDYLIGITHILRGADLVKEDFIENFIWEHFNWKKAEFLHYGRINFSDMKLSKTFARNMIKKQKYIGWDDPRTWSLQSLKLRGFKPEALKEVLLDLGLSMSGITFSVNWLYAKNKSLIDNISERYFYVENPVDISINAAPFNEYIAEPLLIPTNPEKGTRKIKCEAENDVFKLFISYNDTRNLKVNDVIRLKDFMNIKIKDIDEGGEISAIFHSKELDRQYSIIQWVPQKNFVKVSILMPNGTISKGLGEINLKTIPLYKPIQFERYGFVNPVKINEKKIFCYFTH
ncbi:MAG: glutamate--tRNA ligase, partial [Promethearchaeota archaeon]